MSFQPLCLCMSEPCTCTPFVKHAQNVDPKGRTKFSIVNGKNSVRRKLVFTSLEKLNETCVKSNIKMSVTFNKSE